MPVISLLRSAAKPAGSRICVAHLVRRKNDIEPLLRFVQSYTSHPPGIPCDLVIIYKGFLENRIPPEYAGALGDLPHSAFFVDDRGFDILPYFKAAHYFPYDYFCFLNSFSVILDDGWLGKLYMHLSGNDVGIVGATGSWQSIYSDSLKWRRQGIPSWKRALATPFKLYLKMHFDPFPNYHVRTTAFMISRDTMLGIRHGGIRTKMSAWIFESGKEGLTKQILAAGKRVLIVGRDGRAYEKEEWIRSGIFWQGKQENLLVADKQTQRYAQGDERECEYLRSYAWWDSMEPESGEDACVSGINHP